MRRMITVQHFTLQKKIDIKTKLKNPISVHFAFLCFQFKKGILHITHQSIWLYQFQQSYSLLLYPRHLYMHY
jgi:hypothetical protein